MIVYGDSITEGDINMNVTRSASSQDANQTYGWYLSEILDAEVGIIGFYGQQWSWFSATWSYYAVNKQRIFGGLFSPSPDYVIINYGENDGNPGPASSTVTANLASIRAAAPTAKIVLNVPFSGRARTNLTAASLPIGAIRTDLHRYEFLNGCHQWSFDGQHPTAQGHANLAALLGSAINSTQAGLVSRIVTLTMVDYGGTPKTNLTGLKWAFFDQTTPDVFATPVSSGAVESTDGAGQIVVSVNTALPSGGVGWLIVTDSDGTTGMVHKAFSGPVMVA
jgi:hypothetical protein